MTKTDLRKHSSANVEYNCRSIVARIFLTNKSPLGFRLSVKQQMSLMMSFVHSAAVLLMKLLDLGKKNNHNLQFFDVFWEGAKRNFPFVSSHAWRHRSCDICTACYYRFVSKNLTKILSQETYSVVTMICPQKT